LYSRARFPKAHYREWGTYIKTYAPMILLDKNVEQWLLDWNKRNERT
jgi:hypothetical protein